MTHGKAAKKATRPLTDLLIIFAGPAIWFGHFVFIYGAETLVCLGPTAPTEQRLLLTYAVATVVALCGLGFLAAAVAQNNRFHARTALALALLAIPAVVWTALPAALLPVCAS